jgi:hypothetical protein
MGRLTAKVLRRLKVQGNRCCWCGQYLAPQFASPEHIIPKSMGGADSYENLAAAHKSCNTARSYNINLDPAAGPQFEFIRTRLKRLRDAEPDGLILIR